MLIGYARVSTEDQDLTLQRSALKDVGCERISEEKVTGARRTRPQLARMLDQLRAGDVVVVSRLDRLARSTRDLLEIAEQLNEAGAGLRSLHEPWADIAPRSPGKGDRLQCETFHRNPAGHQSRPAEPGQQPEASLAWWAGNLPCEAETARPNAVRLSPEIQHRGEPSSLSEAGAPSGTPHPGPPSPPGPPRVGEQGEWSRGFPGNLGDPTVSTPRGRKESRMTNSGRIPGPASRAVGDEQGTHGWYRPAKETKRGAKGGRESEHLVGSSKRGNR